MPAKTWAIGVAVVVLSACGGSGSAQETAPNAASSSAGTTTGPGQPPGGPAPPELEGTWVLVSPPADPGEPESQLELSGRHYDTSRRASGGLPNGQIAVDGNEIAFFNTPQCELFLPEGVGHYRWKVSGERLHLDVIGKDPCTVRDSFLKHVIYERAG
jgi:hypothetical protein